MKTIVRVLTILTMLMVFYIPAVSQSGIWSNEGIPTGFGTQKEDVFVNESADDLGVGLAVGEVDTPIHDGLGVILAASLLYGIYLVRKQNCKNVIV